MKRDRPLGIVPELAVQRGCQRQSLVIAFMAITVKHGIDLLERTTLNVLIAVTILKQFFRILHNLNWRSPQPARLNFHVGGVQAMGSANLEKIVRFRLAALGRRSGSGRSWPAVPAFAPTAFVGALLGNCRAPSVFQTQCVVEKWHTTVSTHQIAPLHIFILTRAKF